MAEYFRNEEGKLVPAPIQNEYAKKYNCNTEIKDILKIAKENKDIVYIYQILEEKPYIYKTIEDWCKKSDEVRLTYEKVKEILKSRLMIRGLEKKYSEGMTKFELINNHGYREKQEIQHSGDETQPINVIIQGQVKEDK